MKKLLATVLLSAISVGGVFAFTACNPAEEEGQQPETKVTQVTEDKWKEALSYLTVEMDEHTGEPILTDNPRTDLKCEYNLLSPAMGTLEPFSATVSVDYTNSVSGFEYTVGQDGNEAIYAWKENDVYYDVSEGGRYDSATGIKTEFYIKSEIDEEKFLMGCDTLIFAYAGGDQISMLNLTDKYEEFTYSEEKEEYTATLDYNFYEMFTSTADVTVKFENDKLVYLSVDCDSGEHGEYHFKYNYTYGAKANVPENYLNMELGETAKN